MSDESTIGLKAEIENMKALAREQVIENIKLSFRNEYLMRGIKKMAIRYRDLDTMNFQLSSRVSDLESLEKELRTQLKNRGSGG